MRAERPAAPPVVAAAQGSRRGRQPAARRPAWTAPERCFAVAPAACPAAPLAAARRQRLPSSSTIAATSCSEAANAFYDSTFSTPARFHLKTTPLWLSVARGVGRGITPMPASSGERRRAGGEGGGRRGGQCKAQRHTRTVQLPEDERQRQCRRRGRHQRTGKMDERAGRAIIIRSFRSVVARGRDR